MSSAIIGTRCRKPKDKKSLFGNKCSSLSKGDTCILCPLLLPIPSQCGLLLVLLLKRSTMHKGFHSASQERQTEHANENLKQGDPAEAIDDWTTKLMARI